LEKTVIYGDGGGSLRSEEEKMPRSEPSTFDEALPFSEGLAAVKVDNKWGFIDTEGHLAIRPQFAAAFCFREGVATVFSELGTQIVDRSGTAISEGFETIDFVSEGRVPLMRNAKWGSLDLQGKPVIPLTYDEMRPFSGGLAAVQKENKLGYIDRNGMVTIPFQFDHADAFANGLAPVRIGKETGFIDRSGKFVFRLKFSDSSGFFGLNSAGLFIADSDVAGYWTEDHLFGYVNSSGKVICGPSPEGPSEHGPWSEADKIRSCEGVPESVQKTIVSFPGD